MRIHFPFRVQKSFRLQLPRSFFLAVIMCSVAAGVISAPRVGLAASTGLNSIAVKPCTFDPNNPLTRSYFILQLKPGSSYTNCIQFFNNTSGSLPITIGAADAFTAASTGTVYSGQGQQNTRDGKWITIDGPTIRTVAASGSTSVQFTIHVPADAAPGDHLAGIRVTSGREGSGGNKAVNVHVAVAATVGVLMILPNTTTTTANFSLAVYGASITPFPGLNTASILIPMEDVGLLYGKPYLTLTLMGQNGYSKTLSRQLSTMLPGNLINYQWSWPTSLATGTYTVSIHASWNNSTSGSGTNSGSISKTFTTTLKAPLQSSSKGKIVIVQSTNLGLIGDWWFWASIVGGLLVIVLAIILIRRFLRKRAEKKARPHLENRLRSL